MISLSDYPSLEAVNADKRTHGPIPLKALEILLGRTGLGVLLRSLAVSDDTPQQVRASLAEFVAFIDSPRQTHLGTDEADIAEQTAAVLAYLVSVQASVADHIPSVYALGGGLRIPEPVTQAAYDLAVAKDARIKAAKAVETAAKGEANAAYNALVAQIEAAETIEALDAIGGA